MEGVISQFGIDLKVFVWEVVNFLVVLTILYFLIFRTLGNILDTRQKKIQEGIDNALKAEEMISDTEKERQQVLQEAEKQASETINASVVRAKEREQEIINQATATGDEIAEEARSQAEKEKQDIIDGSKEEIARLVVLGAEKVLSDRSKA